LTQPPKIESQAVNENEDKRIESKKWQCLGSDKEIESERMVPQRDKVLWIDYRLL
jgi:hypothetical protein